MTEIVQPIDAGFGRSLRCKIGNLLDEGLMDPGNLLKWETKMTAAERRVLVLYLIGEANEKILQEDYDELRIGCFRRTGFLITATVDERYDCMIKPQGITTDFNVPTTPLVREENNDEENVNVQDTEEEGFGNLDHYLADDNESDDGEAEIDN